MHAILNWRNSKQEMSFSKARRQDNITCTRAAGLQKSGGLIPEPIALTYYMLMDMGNMLLFEPNDTTLKNRIRLAADRLLSWMQPNGSWAVAYDNSSTKELF